MSNTTPVALTVKFHGRLSITSTESQQLLFADCKLAKKAFGALYKATKAYESRANDRERYVLVNHLSGECFMDISEIASVAYQDELKDGIREVVEEWQRGVGRLIGTGENAREAAKSAEQVA